MLLRLGRDVDGGYGTAIISAILAVAGLAVNLELKDWRWIPSYVLLLRQKLET